MLGVMILYFKHLWSYAGDDTKAVEAIGINLGSIITLVLGYYFGSAVGEKQAKTAVKEKNIAKGSMIEDVNEMQGNIQAKLNEIELLKKDLENILKG